VIRQHKQEINDTPDLCYLTRHCYPFLN